MKSQTVARMVFSSFVLTIVALFSLAISVSAQPAPQQVVTNTTPRSKVKVVWIRLAESSIGHEITHTVQQQSGRVTATDGAGNFSFADIAPGEYILTLHLTDAEARTGPGGSNSGGKKTVESGTGSDPRINTVDSSLDLKSAHVTLTGASGGTIEKDWDFGMKKASDLKRHIGQPKYGHISVRVDRSGSRVLKGIVSLLK